MKNDTATIQYIIKLEPTILHYKFLLTQQSSLLGSLLNDLYILNVKDEERQGDFLECWEFLMIIEHVEPAEYNRESLKELFFKNADTTLKSRQTQVMSLSRFSRLCVMKGYLSKLSQKAYFKKSKITHSFNLDNFCSKFRSEYMASFFLTLASNI